MARNADKTFICGTRVRGTSHDPGLPCWRGHESHRPALELLRATVRGAPDVRGTVHPPTALVCWQVCGPLTAPMASILRHHPGGARQAAPGGPVDDPGAAAATRLRLSSTAQPDIRLHSVGGRRLSGAATEPTFDESRAAVPGSSVGASRSLRRPPSCYRGAAPVAGRPMPEARTAASRRASWPHSCLAGPPGPTAEPGGLWSPWTRSRVRV